MLNRHQKVCCPHTKHVFLLLLGVFPCLATAIPAKCEVFDPFKVVPDNNKYQIGGAFPLHQPDCLQLIPSTVQEIVTVQWALSHWNQKQGNSSTSRLGFFAGDSCSRPKEAISQTLRFLDSVDYHEPVECQQKTNSAKPTTHLAAILSPKDRASSSALAGVLRPTNVPVVAYTTASLQEYIDQGVTNLISTAPTLDSYVQTLVQVLQLLKSNLVAIVQDREGDSVWASKVSAQLKQAGIHVAEVVSYDHVLLNKVLLGSDSQIIVSLVSNRRMKKELKLEEKLLKSKKIWITLELNEEGEEEREDDIIDFLEDKVTLMNALPDEIKLQLIAIRAKYIAFDEFNAYFLRVLSNNYNSFSLLASYVRHVFNCSTEKNKSLENNASSSAFELCNLESKELLKLFRSSKNIMPLFKAVYAIALAVENIEGNADLKELCESSSSSIQCYESITKEVLHLDYDFSKILQEVPAELKSHSLRFHLHTTGDHANSQVILLSDITLEAVLVEREGREGSMLYKLLETKTDEVSKFALHSVPTKLRSIQSICQPYKPNCGRCTDEKGELAVKKMDDDSIFLSNPQQYSLYLAGLFDFHEGPNCEILLRENVGLPLAFAYSLWSYKARSAQLNLLNGVDFGAILIDSCSSDRTVMEFLVDSENNCYKFSQADSNWTVVAGSTFGYISTSSIPKSDLSQASPPPPTVIQRFFASKNSPAPVVLIDGDQRSPSKGQLFTAMPSHEGLAKALVKYLRRMHWDYVNVVLDKEDADSISQLHQFEQHSKGICIASISSSIPNPAEPIANVTVLFTSAKVAADYLSGRLRQWNGGNEFEGIGYQIYVMVGEAHDFYLHDPTNLAHYSGTVSIQPKDVLHEDFREWLEGVTPLTLPETWFWRHVEEYWHCALSLKNKDLYQGRMCTGDELLNVPQMGRLTKAGYLSKSVEILLLAADQVHRKLCLQQAGICAEFAEYGRLLIRNLLAETVIEEEFEVLEFQPIDHHGNFGYQLLANYSARAGFHHLENYKSYSKGMQLSSSQPLTSQCQSPLCKCAFPSSSNSHRRFSPSSNDRAEAQEELFYGSYIKKVPAGGGKNVEELLVYDADFEPLSGEEWPSRDTLKYVFLCLTIVFTVLALATLILVCVKMYFRIVKGNQSLGILLLISIILLYTTTYSFVSEPSDVVCRCRIMLHATAHTLCFGVMIVKAIQLQNAETLRVVQGYQLSYWNYWLLMFFILAVQLAISLRWLAEPLTFLEPISNASRMRCSYSTSNFFLAEAYNFVLLLLALSLSTLNRNIKRNYKESKWLFGASFTCTLVMILWILFQAFASPVYIDYITILELYLTGTILLTFLFGPKIYVLLSYEPVIVECTYGQFALPNKNCDLFEADLTSSRTTSPTLSSRTASPMNGAVVKSDSGSSKEAPNSIFQTVLRKKNTGMRRSQSENEHNLNGGLGRGVVMPVSNNAGWS